MRGYFVCDRVYCYAFTMGVLHMIRLFTHKGIQIQQWFNKYSFRVDNGQWFEYSTLAQAKKAIGEL